MYNLLVKYLQSGREKPFDKLAVNIKGDRIKNLTILKLSTSVLIPYFEQNIPFVNKRVYKRSP